MKRIFKIFVIILVAVFIVTGCKDKDDEEEEKPETNIYEEYEKNIDVVDFGKYDGEFGFKFVVLKITNYNPDPLYVEVDYEFYNSDKWVMYTKNQVLRVGSRKTVYAVARQDPEENAFYNYTYKVKVRNEKINNYEETYNFINATGRNTGSNIIATFSNVGNRTTSVYGLVIFYKSGNIVEIKEANYYNLMPTGIKEVEVDYPYQLSFDKYEVVLNEVGTEL